MALTNHWFTLIWLVVVGLILTYAMPQQKEYANGKYEYRWNVKATLILMIPYVIWAGFRAHIGDTEVYRSTFLKAPSVMSAIPEYLVENTKDKGFSILMIAMKSIIGNADVVFFILIAIFQMVCLALVYRKYSTNFLFSIFLFIASADYYSWMFNGMRQFIAAAGIFACTALMLKKKYVPLIIAILLLSTIHGSALIMLPIVFIAQGKAWNIKTIGFLALMVIAVAFVDQFTPFLDNLMSETQYGDVITNEIWVTDDGTNIIRVLVYSIPAILSLIGKKVIDTVNDPVINLSVNMSICAAAFYLLSSVTSGIYMGRMPIYMSLYSYISLPWMLKNIFTPRTSKYVYGIAIIAYVLYFYYQMFIVWG